MTDNLKFIHIIVKQIYSGEGNEINKRSLTYTCICPLTEDDQPSPSSQATPINIQQPSNSSITPSTSNTSNSFSLTAQTQMLGQAYSAESSNFGPIYHTAITHGSYSNPYDRYSKMSPPSSHHATTVAYNSGYQAFYSPHQTSHHHHAMIRQNGCIDYLPR